MAADPRLQQVASAICVDRGLTLGAEVGAGAFKTTFEVRLGDGSARALKLYRKAGADARTQREVDAIKRCSHPGIVRFEYIEVWRDGADDYIYSIEEFLDGGTLTKRMVTGLMTPQVIRQLAASLADAIAHVAGLGLVHRDIKPDNIMFRSTDHSPVLVDFGLVRDLQQMSLTNTWLPQGPGTPFFAPPEQLNNEKHMIDWRADQFSLGVAMTVCGIGRHPYALAGNNPLQVIERVARREGTAPEFLAWAASNELDALTKMVAPWPIQRYRTPQQLVAALQSPSTP